MNRYLYRAQYSLPDGRAPIAGVTVSYEPICVRALTEAEALVAVTDATARYPAAVGATRTLTLVTVTADV
jgi:hypothetical protein